MDSEREFEILTRRRQALELLFKNGDVGRAEYVQLSSRYEALFDKVSKKLDEKQNLNNR